MKARQSDFSPPPPPPFRILKALFRILKALFRILKALFRILKALFRILKALFRILKALFRILKASFRILKALFRILKALFRIFKAPPPPLPSCADENRTCLVDFSRNGNCQFRDSLRQALSSHPQISGQQNLSQSSGELKINRCHVGGFFQGNSRACILNFLL